MGNNISMKNGKRIARNTLLLYLRMIVTTAVSLFTVRLTLQILGASDFGYFNLVAGIVGLTAIVTATMTSATQRFLAYDLGLGDLQAFSHTYSMLINVFMVFCLIAAAMLELAGPLCLPRLNIAGERLDAIVWLYQFAILSFVFSTLCIPFTSAMIAHERMDVYAYLMFIDVVFKLAIVYALLVTPFDRLATLGALTALGTLAVTVASWLYCRHKLPGCRYSMVWDGKLFRRLADYGGWNLLGSLSAVLITQGQTIILNIFFGPVVIAAKAIADRIQGVVVSFANNFYMAVAPQIVKSYAAGDISYMRRLVMGSSRYSFYLLLLISAPLIFCMQDLLTLWLGASQTSRDMLLFAQLELVKSLVFVLENPVTMAVRATGNIKRYQIMVGIQTLTFLPICYLAFRSGLPAWWSMIILSLLLFVVQFTRVYLVRRIIGTSTRQYMRDVLSPLMLTAAAVVTLHMLTRHLLSATGQQQYMLVVNLAVSFCLTALSIYFIGLNSTERHTALNMIKTKLPSGKAGVLLCLLMPLGSVSCDSSDDTFENSSTYSTTETIPAVGDTLRVLAIGNSYTKDGTTRIDEWGEADCRHWCVYSLTTSSASLDLWANRMNTSETFKMVQRAGNMTMPTDSGTMRQLLSQAWDVVVVQQVSSQAPYYSTYNPALHNIIHNVRARVSNTNLLLAWQFIWSYADGYNGKNSNKRWQQIADATCTLQKSDSIDIIIPTGTAIQNARHTALCDDQQLTRDGTHLNELGQYIAAGVWFKTLLARKGPTNTPSAYSDAELDLITRCVDDAMRSPYTITLH